MAIGRVPGQTGIQPSIVTAKGDLIVATASGSVTNQSVGSNNQVLTADSAQADGVKWANGSAATLTTTGDIIYASAANTPARLGIGSSGQVLTVSGGVPSWGAAGSSFAGVRLRNSANQTISNNTDTIVTFDTEDFDSDAYHSTSSNTGRITIPSGKGGKYLVNCQFLWDANNSGNRWIFLRKNGSASMTIDTNSVPYADGWSTGWSSILDLSVGDYIEIIVKQTSGGNRTLYTTSPYGWFTAGFLGA